MYPEHLFDRTLWCGVSRKPTASGASAIIVATTPLAEIRPLSEDDDWEALSLGLHSPGCSRSGRA